MGRKKSPGKRTKSGQLSRALEALGNRNPPADYVAERRETFSFLQSGKDPEGRGGTIDQDVCDGIGQFCALGLLDGHGYEARDLRDSARLFRDHYWRRYADTAPKTSKHERSDRSYGGYDGETSDDRKFDAMDEAVTGYERAILFDAVVDRAWGDDFSPWMMALIHGELLKRKRPPRLMRFATADDWGRLCALVRALCAIHEATIGPRYRRAA